MLAAVPLPAMGDGGSVAGGSGGLTVGDVLARIRGRWPVIAVPVAVGLALAVLATLIATPVYTARASVLVQPVIAEQFGSVNLDNVLNMATEAELASSLAVATTAGETLGLEPDEVRRSLSVSSPQGTQVLDISYRSSTAQAAAQGAQTVATAFLAYREANAAEDADRSLVSVQEQIKTVDEALAAGGDTASYRDSLRSLLAVQRQLTSIKATSGGRVITTAVPPTDRTAPRLPVNLAVGGMAALLAGLVVAVFGPSRRERVPTATV